ncbi:MAG TPA: 50S ribosomal protein L10, partial [Acidimicrobiales bacterium]|nr:50S ribosomal protein L10 [Acidimicrobiales bacterium]
MDNPRPEKVAVVEEVRQRLDASAGAILTEYRGLKVAEMARLRRTLTEAGGEYKVYKNTLVRFAARDLGLDDLIGLLEGPTAIAFVQGDAAAVAKALRDFSRVNPALVVKGGLLGGNVLNAERTTALAELPSREVLLARFAGGLAAPLQQLAGLLQALPRNLAYGLKALIDKGGAGPAPTEAAAAPAEAAPAEPTTTDEAASEPTPVAQNDEPVPPSAEAAAPATEEAAEAAEAAAPRVDAVSDTAEPEAAPAGPESDAAVPEATPESPDSPTES